MNAPMLSGSLFHTLVKGGAANLYAKRAAINDLNVFPIPDGDTGDNMYMTIRAGATCDAGDNLGEVSSAVAHGMLLGARGNSGVILSRIFAGIAEGFSGVECADGGDVIAALQSGIRQAYGAVSDPVEGTILTVYREAADYTAAHLEEARSVSEALAMFRDEAERSLERTPDLLAVLKEAGVVDSGGAGLLAIVEGMMLAADGRIDAPLGEAESHGEPLDLSLFTEDSVLEYGYCTEFLLRLQRCKTDLDNFDIDGFAAHLNAIGESVVAFRDGTVVKVHVHTKTPSEVLAFGQQFGEFLTLKIENMTLQHHGVEEKKQARKPHKKYAVVTVAAGTGIRDTFVSMGADAVIDGGQCMNPSVADFVDAFKGINADTILVFPSNSNILLTAEQAAGMYDDADIRVIPCRSVGETYAALSVLDTSSNNTDEIVGGVTDFLGEVVSASVSRADRDAEMSGVSVKAGDFIGYGHGRIVSAAERREDAVMQLAAALGAKNYGLMLLICGADADADEAQRLYEALSAAYRRTEVIMINGDQPVQDYILVLE